MKVLQICSFYAVNNLYKNLFNGLKDIGVESDIYIPCRPKNIPNKIEENEMFSRVYKNGDNLYEKFINIFSQYEFYIKNNRIYEDLKNKVNLNKYNIIHAHSLFENGYLAYKAKKEYGIEYIVALRNTDVNGYFKNARHLRKLGIEIMKNAKKVIFISPSYKEFVIDNFIRENEKVDLLEKFQVIPNGIDDFWIENIYEEKERKDSNVVNLIHASRIDKNKNVETSIEIAKTLRKKGIESYIKIIGDGPEKGNLMCIYKEMEYVEFLDKVSKEELIDEYDKSDILIMPSKFETFGLVYPEAMTRGLPVIYTRNQGFDNYFKEGVVGYPIKYNDVNEGSDSVIKILNNYKEISKNCIENSRRFSWKKICKTYKKIYKD